MEMLFLFTEKVRVEHTCLGIRCVFTSAEVCTFFLNYAVEKGIFRWAVTLEYNTNPTGSNPVYRIGGAPVNLLNYHNDRRLGNKVGSYAFELSVNRNMSIGARLIVNACSFGGRVFPVSSRLFDNSETVLEVDADARTLSAFVDGKKATWVVTNIHLPLQLGISGNQGSFISRSFYRLPAATPSSPATPTPIPAPSPTLTPAPARGSAPFPPPSTRITTLTWTVTDTGKCNEQEMVDAALLARTELESKIDSLLDIIHFDSAGMTEAEKKTIMAVVEKTETYLEGQRHCQKDYERWVRDIETVANPIMTAVFIRSSEHVQPATYVPNPTELPEIEEVD